MQAHRQWMSRAPDERFTSLIDMQAFKRWVRENSRSHVLSSRKVNVQPMDDPRGLRIMGGSFPAAAPTHWSFGQLCSLASPGNSPASYFRETNTTRERKSGSHRPLRWRKMDSNPRSPGHGELRCRPCRTVGCEG
jgi:hypothetical protein